MVVKIFFLDKVVKIFYAYEWSFQYLYATTGNFIIQLGEIIKSQLELQKWNESPQISIYIHFTSTPCDDLHIQREIENRNMRGGSESSSQRI